MKNSIYLLMMFLGLALTSCEPMEDLHDDVDDTIANTPIIGIEEYTLTEADYETLEIEDGVVDNLDDAGALIPEILAENFPFWGEGSLAQVTFDLNAPIVIEEYTVSEEGYEALDLGRNYFVKTSEIKDFLEYQFQQATLNDYVELTYRTVAVEQSYTLTGDDFDLIEDEFEVIYPEPAGSAGQYGNFERREDRDAYWNNDMILEALNVVMEENFTGIEGQTYEVSYKIYDGSPGEESMNIKYNGSSYVTVGAAGMPFEYEDSNYELIGVELAEAYPGPSDNAAYFKSFDVRSTSDNFWSEEMILEAMNIVLMDEFPDATEGAHYDVTYKIFPGGSTEEVMSSFILEDGEYVAYEPEVSTVMETQVFGFGDNSWHMPIILPDGIYQSEFEQQYGNFGNEATAGFYIGRWLEPRFPYAQDGDFVSVEYKMYSGGLVTRYASFVYNEEDREWEFIPTVIPYTLQFGYEDTGWVVDNTIVHVLTDSDYEYIESQLIDTYPGPADSAGYYKNFDRRKGNSNQWTDAMLLEAMDILLSGKVAPNAEEGQKYLLVFDIYNGTNTTEQLHLIKTDGEWVRVK
ncbi:hypothetical protein [Salinimicrobium sediminilitoris]|uniref:hypothetical protein n=1 Tax=Salinimicrobium sediminilitoris TaxID=2876715 RepID=UPI001E64FDF4|nr:hypothetical protein [Salinimicrobium sediminilitoris]MCC8359349.1 hypothetical protein [Salinimicrobium sediminilitoris]